MNKKLYTFEECEEMLNYDEGFEDQWNTEEDEGSIICIDERFIRIPSLEIDAYVGSYCEKKYCLNDNEIDIDDLEFDSKEEFSVKRYRIDDELVDFDEDNDELEVELENAYDVFVICKIKTREILYIEGMSFLEVAISNYTGKSPKGLICEIYD